MLSCCTPFLTITQIINRATQAMNSPGEHSDLVVPRPASSPDAMSSGKLRILIVDDERLMRDLMSMSLRRLNYVVEAVADGTSALYLLANEHFDLVMLDVVLTDINGFALLAELRTFSDVPVVMLTAMNRPDDVVRGFELGADNYITKPFNFKEVEARIRAVLRRATHLLDGASFDVAAFGDLRIYNVDQRAEIGGRPIDLTPNEFMLLRYLALRADRPVSKEELLHEVWGYDEHDSANIVELAIRRLRTKLEADPAHPNRLVTVRGVGYKFASQTERLRG